jgi:hypothetical protein
MNVLPWKIVLVNSKIRIMKRIFIVFAFCSIAMLSYSQPEPAKQMAEKIAIRMKDSLGLTEQQKQQVYDINILLFNQKAAARQAYNGTSSLSVQIQKIEKTRDSLYQTVLPPDKYFLYRGKKKTLVHNNPAAGQ